MIDIFRRKIWYIQTTLLYEDLDIYDMNLDHFSDNIFLMIMIL